MGMGTGLHQSILRYLNRKTRNDKKDPDIVEGLLYPLGCSPLDYNSP